MHEWPLLIFTLLVQTAIGGMLALSVYIKITKTDEQTIYQLTKLPLIVISVISLIGLAASFSHLGTPLHALYTITNLGSSWFSREIIFVGLLIFLTLVTLGLSLLKKKVNITLMYITSFVGLCAVFVMASIYANSLIGAWHGIGTYAAFYSTALVIGATIVGALCRQQTEQSLFSLFLIASVGIALKMVFLPVHFANVVEFSSAQQPFLYGQLILNIVGLIFLSYVTFIRKSSQPIFLWISFIIIFIGEFIGRYMFFMNAI